MPAPDGTEAADLSRLLEQVQQGNVTESELLQQLGSKPTTGSIDLAGLTESLKGGGDSGPSFLDPTYLMVSGTLQILAMGFLIHAKRAGNLNSLAWGLACLTLSWDYTSLPCWGIAVALAVAGRFAR